MIMEEHVKQLRKIIQVHTDCASHIISVNQECFVAKWILQNPNENISDWELVYRPSWSDDYISFSMKKINENPL